MKLDIRRTLLVSDERPQLAGRPAETPLLKIAIVTVVANPFVDRYVEDLSPLIVASVEIGRMMAERAIDALAGAPVQSYGKAGLVGLRGEQEHANALLTTAFANPIRDAIGGGNAWISSMTKVAPPGALIDVPMNHKEDVYVRSHYDGMSLAIPELPMPDEIALIICLANRGRLNARVGGMTHDEATAKVRA
ncbi:amino acid synthesis family protein [Enterovirga sp. CN4-39]|uniref:amino acid synthesis family protein n=1 Tax=Enterovirga sp. CN4-39 TaxID=3400910 RepID=UPI003C0AE41C